MVRSCTGHVNQSLSRTLLGIPSSDSHFVTAKFLTPPSFSPVTDAVYGARSRMWRLFNKQAMAYKEANPQMFVRIIALVTARVMNTNNSRCYPWEDKKQ